MSTDEEIAFQRAYSKLVQGISSDPALLAGMLWSASIIGHQARMDAETPTVSPSTRATALLSAVGDQIKVTPKEKFPLFVKILKEEKSLVHLAKLLDPSIVVHDPSSAASGLPSSSSQTEFRESFSSDEVVAWMRRIGLTDGDITLLVDDGFGTAPAFKMLTAQDLIEMKVSRAGRRLLGQYVVAPPHSGPRLEQNYGLTSGIGGQSVRRSVEVEYPVREQFTGGINQGHFSPSRALTNEIPHASPPRRHPNPPTQQPPPPKQPSLNEILQCVDNERILDEDDLTDILYSLEGESARWSEICTHLNIKRNTICGLASSNKPNIVRLTDALTDWLQLNYNYWEKGKPTWRKVAEGVEKVSRKIFLEVGRQHLKKGVSVDQWNRLTRYV